MTIKSVGYDLRPYYELLIKVIRKMILYLSNMKMFTQHINRSPQEINISLPFDCIHTQMV